MTITYSQVMKLLSSVAIAVPDELDCDGCFELIAELADAEIESRDLSASLQLVRNHLGQCRCCKYEYETLLEALSHANEV